MKASLKIVLFALLSITIAGCSGRYTAQELENENKHIRERFEEERAELKKELALLRFRVNDEILLIDTRMESANAELLIKLKASKKILENERSELDLHIKDLKNSTQENWEIM